jgi:hypothetical protein
VAEISADAVVRHAKQLKDEGWSARTIQAHLTAARRAWIAEARSAPEEYLRREHSDFLAAANHEGEVIDFHALRHTCGAWLAMAGAHPKVVQTVMRHSTITLTMDTYGHLFPGQDPEAVARMPNIVSADPRRAGRLRTTEEPRRAERSAAHAQQSGRVGVPEYARGCDEKHRPPKKWRKPETFTGRGLVRDRASQCEAEGKGLAKQVPRSLWEHSVCDANSMQCNDFVKSHLLSPVVACSQEMSP